MAFGEKGRESKIKLGFTLTHFVAEHVAAFCVEEN